jgi:hypothetical protein
MDDAEVFTLTPAAWLSVPAKFITKRTSLFPAMIALPSRVFLTGYHPDQTYYFNANYGI